MKGAAQTWGTRRCRFRLEFLAVVLLLAAGSSTADPARLLRAAAEADRRLSYTGIETVSAPAGPERAGRRVRVWHLAPDQTRIEFLDASGDVLLENGSRRWFHSHRWDGWRPVPWRATGSRLDLLLRNYSVRRDGQDTVAGRQVVRLKIEPRYPGNPHKVIWIDPVWKLRLREEVRDSEGRLIGASGFEQIELVKSLPPDLFAPPPGPPLRGGAPAVQSAPSSPPFTPLRPRYVPPGYQEVPRDSLRRGPRGGVHLRYTDGLGAISLFEFPKGTSPFPPHPPASGEDRAGRWRRDREANRITRQIGDLECTIIGDIDQTELRKMLDSLPSRS